MGALWARVVKNRIVEIIPRPVAGQRLQFDRLVNIAGRPDLKVGSEWNDQVDGLHPDYGFGTVDRAIEKGLLERAPTDGDPRAIRVPIKKEGA